jgi:dinuclear metal center YbgI/SA1388 family protein
MYMKLIDLINCLDTLMHYDPKMDVGKIDPYMANGLMVKGRQEAKKIGFGVSASVALFEKAVQEGCDVIIVHHAFNLPPYNRYDPIYQNRMGYLIKKDVSLFGYHFLLDSHPSIGNNVEILKVIGCKPTEPYAFHGAPWGFVGDNEKGVQLQEVWNILKPAFSPRAVMYDFGPKTIHRVVAISGKGSPGAADMTTLLEKKTDLYITGEPHEWVRELFREAGINFIAGGHYHTEMFGIKALMETVRREYKDVTVSWLDLENDI